MALPTIEELLKPLVNRINDIEEGDISPSHIDDYTPVNNTILKELNRNIDLLPKEDTIPKIELLVQRMVEVIETDIDFIEKHKKEFDEMPFIDDNSIRNIIIDELRFYISGLEKYSNRVQKYAVKGSIQTVNTSPCIELPENWKIGTYKDKFDSRITSTQAAYFLRLLVDYGLSPAYTDNSLGKIAHALFFKSQQRCKTILGNIDDEHNHDDLRNLVEIFEEFITNLNGILKAGEKRPKPKV